jgi:hypothetical protein
VYVIKLGKKYLTYGCGKRIWQPDITKARVFKSLPVGLMEHLPDAVEIINIQEEKE